MKTSELIRNPAERDCVAAEAKHFAEIIQNDGIGHFFDETDAFQLCQSVVALVDALNISVAKNEKTN